jgi:hypothetical protein
MTVFILWFNNFQGEQDFNGVFSTRELAEERISELTYHERQQHEIEEWEVDSK